MLVDQITVLVDLKLLRLETTKNSVLILTDRELDLNQAILLVDRVYQLRDVDLSERLTKQGKGDRVKQGERLAVTVVADRQASSVAYLNEWLLRVFPNDPKFLNVT